MGREWFREKKFMYYKAEDVSAGDRPKKRSSEIVKKDCWTRQPHSEDTVDDSEWRKLIKDIE